MPRLVSLGRYEIVSELGQGAMGTVYKAVDPRLDRIVALKTVKLDPSSPDYTEFRERFHAEAKSAGRLSHPNIVTIHDFGEVDGTAYIAMEFLRGETLRQMLDRQRFSVRRAVRYAAQIADGLAAAHADGVVHRDVKPANVLRLPNGLLKITDFGIAQLPTSHLTQAGTLLGTPKYMSPEQMRGMRVDRRSDIFSLGVVLYEMLTGTLPFGGASLSGVGYQIVHDRPIHPVRWNAAIPDALVRILAKCLEKDPDSRYQNMVDFGRDLRHYKDAPVAEDARVEDVFLALDPVSQATVNAANDTPALAGGSDDWLASTLPLDQTLPLGIDAPPIPEVPVAARAQPRRFHARLAAAALAGVAILGGGALYAFQHAGGHAALPGELNSTAAALPTPTPLESSATTPATDIATAPTTPSVETTRAVDATPVAPASGPVHPRGPARHRIDPANAPVTSPVVLTEPQEAPLPPAPIVRSGPSSAEIQAHRKAEEEAAFKLALRKQHDCLVSNRCD